MIRDHKLKFDPIVTGPWDDEKGDVTFTPFVTHAVVGFEVERNGRKQHVIISPSGSGDSPDIWLRIADGEYKTIIHSAEEADTETWFHVLEPTGESKN